MGIVLMARRLTALELERVRSSQEAAEAMSEEDTLDPLLAGRVVDLHKYWQGIHFLLTGTKFDVDDVLGHAVLGGEVVTEDLGFGPIRVVDPAMVQRVAQALRAWDPAVVPSWFTAARMRELDIYGMDWDRPVAQREFLLPWLAALTTLYVEAASHNEAMMLSMH